MKSFRKIKAVFILVMSFGLIGGEALARPAILDFRSDDKHRQIILVEIGIFLRQGRISHGASSG